MNTAARRVLSGFGDGIPRPYAGENIFAVRETRTVKGTRCHLLEHGQWICEVAPDQYTTDWNRKECWGRVVELDGQGDDRDGAGSRLLGFALIAPSRAAGIRLRLNAEAQPCKPSSCKAPPDEASSGRVPPSRHPSAKAPPAKAPPSRAATVDAAACRGCRICFKSCPVQALSFADGRASVGNGCTGCARCTRICPFGAVRLP
ncbi:MAG: 4Fe-4S binding protein [Clostridiales Family XIII bacterium]|nr:4Fe-4S binding protein [Clostridiales Family XIII bacterium]